MKKPHPKNDQPKNPPHSDADPLPSQPAAPDRRDANVGNTIEGDEGVVPRI